MNPDISMSSNDLKWIIKSLGVLLKATEHGLAIDLQNPGRSRQFSNKMLSYNLLKKIHEVFTSIHSTSNSLTIQEHRINRETSNAEETDDMKVLQHKIRTAENDALKRLRDNSPAIAELSDAWGPIVIVKKFNQLYDDEWKDGFQLLCQMGKSDKESIHTLFYILKKCYAFCTSQAEVQIEKIEKALVSFESANPHNQGMRSPKGFPGLIGTPRVTLNELRCQTCVMSKDTVINAYFNQEKGSNTERNALPFVERCLELSWYMVLQTPPVYVDDCVQFTKGSHFIKDLFKPYSRTGTTIDFVVWPPLYLNKGGPLLAKGVAEPIA